MLKGTTFFLWNMAVYGFSLERTKSEHCASSAKAWMTNPLQETQVEVLFLIKALAVNTRYCRFIFILGNHKIIRVVCCTISSFSSQQSCPLLSTASNSLHLLPLFPVFLLLFPTFSSCCPPIAFSTFLTCIFKLEKMSIFWTSLPTFHLPFSLTSIYFSPASL